MKEQAAQSIVKSEELGGYLGLTSRRVSQLAIEGVFSRNKDNSFNLVDSLIGYIRYRNNQWLKKDDDSLSEKDRATIDNLQAKTALSNIEIAKLERNLIPYDDVVTAMVLVIKPLSDMLSDLPDIVERKTGAGAEVVQAILNVVAEQRIEMHQRLAEIVEGHVAKQDFIGDADGE